MFSNASSSINEWFLPFLKFSYCFNSSRSCSRSSRNGLFSFIWRTFSEQSLLKSRIRWQNPFAPWKVYFQQVKWKKWAPKAIYYPHMCKIASNSYNLMKQFAILCVNNVLKFFINGFFYINFCLYFCNNETHQIDYTKI